MVLYSLNLTLDYDTMELTMVISNRFLLFGDG